MSKLATGARVTAAPCWQRGEALLDWARANPAVHKIELLVRAENLPAVALYRAFGFVEEGRLRDRVRLSDGRYVDDVSMAMVFGRRGG